MNAPAPRWTIVTKIVDEEYLLQCDGKTVGTYSSAEWCQIVCDEMNKRSATSPSTLVPSVL